MNTKNDVKIIPAKLGTLVAMCGLPRSGKSTASLKLSKELPAPIVKKDDIRLALHGQVYQNLAEPFVKAISKVMVHSLFLSGHPIVIADETHYSRQARDFMADGPWETKFYLVDTPKEVCIERAHKTGHTWLPPVIEEMAARWEPLGKDEKLYARQWHTPNDNVVIVPVEKGSFSQTEWDSLESFMNSGDRR